MQTLPGLSPDVVAATKVYGYESGNAKETFDPRPDRIFPLPPTNLEQRARAEAKKGDWLAGSER